MATWKCTGCGSSKDSRCKPKKCPGCGSGEFIKDEQGSKD